jgi:hypothetical protein
MKVRCRQCESLFKTYPSRIKVGWGKYCSKKCQNKSQIGNCKYWLGKKRPELNNTGAKETMFKKGSTPWNKGLVGFLSMEKNPSWRGGIRKDDRGYVRISIGNRKYRYEHRLVMDKELGRRLEKEEIVHHNDGIKNNNNVNNLSIMSNKEHMKLHRKGVMTL